MALKVMHWVGIGVGIVSAIVFYTLFSLGSFSNNARNFLLVTSLLIGVVPFMISFLWEQRNQNEKEEKFLEFTRDLVETVRSGTPVGKGIINLRSRNYGSLSPHVLKMANQLSLGITLRDALDTFARETNSNVISRAMSLISEAERAGGKIEVILESVSASVNQVQKLRKERKASVSNLVTQGYMIFIVFIIIMLVLEFKILPLVSDLQSTEGMALSVNAMDSEAFSFPLFVMLLVQSFFAGLVIGKISEGSLQSGVRHSFILLTITLLVTTGARVLFG
jgi:archaeal flagellar protein FlaJ